MVPITGKTRLFGVIGDPVSHSLSPVIHNAVLPTIARDHLYVAFPIAPEHLPAALAGLRASGILGLSVTIPHKQAVMPLLTNIRAIAQQVGAVNTLWPSEQGWQGTNTDVEGFLAPLLALDRSWQDITPVVLGNGGAARAVVAGLATLGCPEIMVVGRSGQKLAQFSASWTDDKITKRLKTLPWQDLPSVLSRTELLVNTTPIGMAPHTDQSPVEEEWLKKLPPTAIAYDLIYTPRPTQFLQRAQGLGLTTIDGVEMLVQQGAAALKIWLNQQDIPVAMMRQALLERLDQQG